MICTQRKMVLKILYAYEHIIPGKKSNFIHGIVLLATALINLSV